MSVLKSHFLYYVIKLNYILKSRKIYTENPLEK